MSNSALGRRLLFGICAASLVVVVVGCGHKVSPITGHVLVDGKPLPGGRITFRPENTEFNSVSADIDEQGAFQVTLPVGKVFVSIDNREFAPRAAPRSMTPDALPADMRSKLGPISAPAGPPAPKQSSRYIKIPERYYTSESGELDFTVESGMQQHDIQLKSN